MKRLPKRVVIESPYAGDVEKNLAYVREAMQHSLRRGEAPYASHALYTQPGVLNDLRPEERVMGIDAGFAWLQVASLQAFYIDLGWSNGMRAAVTMGRKLGIKQIVRSTRGLDKADSWWCWPT